MTTKRKRKNKWICRMWKEVSFCAIQDRVAAGRKITWVRGLWITAIRPKILTSNREIGAN